MKEVSPRSRIDPGCARTPWRRTAHRALYVHSSRRTYSSRAHGTDVPVQLSVQHGARSAYRPSPLPPARLCTLHMHGRPDVCARACSLTWANGGRGGGRAVSSRSHHPRDARCALQTRAGTSRPSRGDDVARRERVFVASERCIVAGCSGLVLSRSPLSALRSAWRGREGARRRNSRELSVSVSRTPNVITSRAIY